MRPVEERFWQKVRKTRSCWLWTGNTNGRYGIIYVMLSGKPVNRYVHRLSFEWAYGPIPLGQQVCHQCDQPLCVRPTHLFLGTPADNVRDMFSKGRAAVGAACPWAKLTPQLISTIRARLIEGDSQTALAREYGLAGVTIHRIAYAETWRHLNLPPINSTTS